MDCPHCHKSIHSKWRIDTLSPAYQTSSNFYVSSMICPACEKQIIKFMDEDDDTKHFYIHPRFPTRTPVPKEVPKPLAEDYEEACAVLTISPKASAALSRRCLQSILYLQGYTGKNLAKQVDAILSETDASKALSPALSMTVDAIRNFGNFSAHPITDVTTQQIIPVDPHEAEFCLEVIEEMFDHFYVKPALAATRKAALDIKLAASGKPASK